MSKATEGKSIDWLTSLCNTTIDQNENYQGLISKVHTAKGIHCC